MTTGKGVCHGTLTGDEVAGREDPAEDFALLCKLLFGKDEVTT